MEVLLTNEDWQTIFSSLQATIRYRETTDNYQDDAFRRAQVAAARETLRRVEALRRQLWEEGHLGT
jgi:hypothetical protein